MPTRAASAPENAMPDIKIVTEVAGRICALPAEVGASIGDGDDIALVEAMKMEIPVASPASGKLKSILVKIDDVVAEGQGVAILETGRLIDGRLPRIKAAGPVSAPDEAT